MSTYSRMTKNPVTNNFEKAVWIDNYFGHHCYGVEFPDGSIIDPDIVDLETRDWTKEEIKQLHEEYEHTIREVTKKVEPVQAEAWAKEFDEEWENMAYKVEHTLYYPLIRGKDQIKDFIRQQRRAVRAEVLGEVKEYAENAFRLLEPVLPISGGNSELTSLQTFRGSWLNYEDLSESLTTLEEGVK